MDIAAEAEPTAYPEPAAYQTRKLYQTTIDYTVIKCGLKKICNDINMNDLIEECVRNCSIIAVEASLLASIHVLRVLDPAHKLYGEEVLPPLDDTFFNQCVSSIANLNGDQGNNNLELTDTLYHHYETLKPHWYENVRRIPKVMTQMLVMIAQQAKQNFVVSMEQTIFKRLFKWLEFKIRQHIIQEGGIEGGNYFAINERYNGRKIAGLMVRCCTGDANATVLQIMNQYKTIRDRPIPVNDIQWMQALCNEVKQSLVITPLQVGLHANLYMPFL